jgi:hypothetical protein
MVEKPGTSFGKMSGNRFRLVTKVKMTKKASIMYKLKSGIGLPS